MRTLWKVADFIRATRRELRFGELSRAPLRLLSLDWHGDSARCEWLARPADSWDQDRACSASVRERRVAEQALQDAIAVRELLFASFAELNTANFRVYRSEEPAELIIAGTVVRDSPAPGGIRSLAMRVKLCGLQFRMENGKLEPLPREGPT